MLTTIIQYDVPEKRVGVENQYLVLESISSTASKVIYVINMEKNMKIYLGRGQEAHVRVSDISVSRLHAFILKSSEGYYYLCDSGSKFGTLV